MILSIMSFAAELLLLAPKKILACELFEITSTEGMGKKFIPVYPAFFLGGAF
jgi:hypothetical protein